MATAIQRLQRIEKTLNGIAENQTKACWVKVGFVTAKTGWDHRKMQRAREQGLIEWEHREDGFWYNINSLSPVFFNNSNA